MMQGTLGLEPGAIGFGHQQNLGLLGKWASGLTDGIETQIRGHTRNLVQKINREAQTNSTLTRTWEQTTQS